MAHDPMQLSIVSESAQFWLYSYNAYTTPAEVDSYVLFPAESSS